MKTFQFGRAFLKQRMAGIGQKMVTCHFTPWRVGLEGKKSHLELFTDGISFNFLSRHKYARIDFNSKTQF